MEQLSCIYGCTAVVELEKKLLIRRGGYVRGRLEGFFVRLLLAGISTNDKEPLVSKSLCAK